VRDDYEHMPDTMGERTYEHKGYKITSVFHRYALSREYYSLYTATNSRGEECTFLSAVEAWGHAMD
jgi:hypothetical protein